MRFMQISKLRGLRQFWYQVVDVQTEVNLPRIPGMLVKKRIATTWESWAGLSSSAQHLLPLHRLLFPATIFLNKHLASANTM